MSGNIIEGELSLSSEHEGYAWVFFEDLHDYELADWFQDFLGIKIMLRIDFKEENEDKVSSKEVLSPWVGSIRTSMDKILKKR